SRSRATVSSSAACAASAPGLSLNSGLPVDDRGFERFFDSFQGVPAHSNGRPTRRLEDLTRDQNGVRLRRGTEAGRAMHRRAPHRRFGATDLAGVDSDPDLRRVAVETPMRDEAALNGYRAIDGVGR